MRKEVVGGDRLRLDLDEGTGPDLDEENEDSSAASHTEV